jgi:catechol 2,3-dioxygenase-like lactoylglutathione lyase family enzyme
MIKSLHCLSLYVPNLEVGKDFYSCMGLIPHPEKQSYVFRCEGKNQDQLRLIQGKKKEIAWVTWSTNLEGLNRIKDNLRTHQIKPHDPKHESQFCTSSPNDIWLRDPDGTLLQIIVANTAEQIRTAVKLNHPGDVFKRVGIRGAPNRQVDSRPRKLGHILKFTPDVNRLVDFYTTILGMKLSDRIGEKELAFLRCSGDSDHHTLALALSDAVGLHHSSWEMGNLDQMQLCAQRLIDAGYQDCWGVGRHIYGSNYFHYIRDPWGGLCELFWDIDFIGEHSEWTVEVADAHGSSLHESLFQWATSLPPDDFLCNFEKVSHVT